MTGKLVILSGPSGAGKSTLAKHLLKKKNFNLAFSVSVCSRKKRNSEIDGEDYYFLSIDEFKTKIEENEFLEWEEVYPNLYYGTLKVEVERLLSQGKNVMFDVDVMGGISIKRKYNERALSVFIKPPSLDVLEDRLISRNTESPENIKKRIRKAKMELNYARRFDHVVVNETLEDAIAATEELIGKFLEQ
ncbi:MAG: guanylate kinase [Bacteroidales bacterium]|nr:guanylate kinase [Bacteroidales bacterium]